MAIRGTLPGRERDWEKMEETGELLYTAYLLPDEGELRPEFGFDLAKKIIYRILDGGETWVSVGRPVFNEMGDLIKESGRMPSPEVQASMKSHRFGYLRLHCGFGGHKIPPTPHPMIEGRMTINISCEPNIDDKPLAYSWIPKDTYDEEKVEREFTVSSNFDLISSASAEVGFTKKKETVLYKPRITVVGGQTDTMTWHYHTTPSIDRVEGDREALMMVRIPLNAKKLKVSVDTEAKIRESFVSRIGLFNHSKKWIQADFKDKTEEDFSLKKSIKISYKDLHRKRHSPNFADELLGQPELSEKDKTLVIPLSS
jgi:hypothetical protein